MQKSLLSEMAEYSSVPSYANLRLQRGSFGVSNFIPRKLCFRIVVSASKKSFIEQNLVRFTSLKAFGFGPANATTLGGRPHLKQSSSRYCCFGTLINPENAAPTNWIPVVDQILMSASIVLAYVAGVAPSGKSYTITGKTLDNDAEPANTSSGSIPKSDHQVNTDYAWNELRGKLLGALDAVQDDESLRHRMYEYEKYSKTFPLSLYAIAEVPRLRLLCATLQQLEKEVNEIPGNLQHLDRDDWLTMSSEMIEKSSQSVSLAWLEGELYLENKKHDKEVLSTIVEKLKGDEFVLNNIKNLGKEDLYADLLFVLRFGSLRVVQINVFAFGQCTKRSLTEWNLDASIYDVPSETKMDCLYESKLLASHMVDILEDLVISLAEGITLNYLELISVDSSMSSEMNQLGLNLCSFSTRELQKLRNEVALKQWLRQNIESVESLYEDRFELFTFCVQPTEVSNKSQIEKLHWWKKLKLGKAASKCTQLHYVVINQLSMSVKRTKELSALNGWRYYYSLFLEFSDIAMPLVRTIFAKVSSGISFLLVCLVGRSLGLIYTGIRQSLGWR